MIENFFNLTRFSQLVFWLYFCLQIIIFFNKLEVFK